MNTTRRRFLALTGGAALGAVAAPRFLHLGARRASAQVIPGAPVFRGAAGKSIQGPITLNAGMTVLRAQHNGTGNFVVTLFLPNPDETPQQSVNDASYTDTSLVYDEIGAIKGGAVAMATVPGDHYLSVTASGAFQISVEQPVPENVTTIEQTVFSGRGKDITPYFTLPDGLLQLSAQTTSTSLLGWLYHLDDLGGEAVAGGVNGYDGRFFDFTRLDNQSAYPVSLPDAGPYLLFGDNIQPTDSWTFSFT